MTDHSSGESGLIVASARALMRQQGVATLATLETDTNDPYASLITTATETDGSPIFLISTLAWHTRNLEANPRASILFAAQAASGDPLNMGRVSVMGVAERTDDTRARRRFLARHPSATFYADFADFSFWRLRVERAHFVGGFGRISTLSAEELMLASEPCSSWDAGIDAVIARVNETEAELVARLSTAKVNSSDRPEVAACDPDGCDIIVGQETTRLSFPNWLSVPEDLPDALKALAHG